MKAILAIDMPEVCDECPLNHDNWYCQVTRKDIEHEEDEDGFNYYPIPSWCPLKTMPKEKDSISMEYLENFRIGHIGTGYQWEAYCIGYNDALKEIANESNTCD